MGTFVDLTNKKFGNLTVISFAGRKVIGKYIKKIIWECKCDCGITKSILGESLQSGAITSCGCNRLKALRHKVTTHGLSCQKDKIVPEYRAWLSMKERCLNIKSKSYKNYGARGIKICDQWKNNFKVFYDYVGDRPSPKHSLDRFPDKNGNYEPNNVRWATQLQQMQNVRDNLVLTMGKKTMVLSEWARYFGVKHEAIRFHLKKGRSMEQIFNHYKFKKENNIPNQSGRFPFSG